MNGEEERLNDPCPRRAEAMCPLGTNAEAKELLETIRKYGNLLSTQGSSVKDHHKTLYGNGRKGIVETMTRLEERMLSVMNWQKIMTGTIASLVIAILLYVLTK